MESELAELSDNLLTAWLSALFANRPEKRAIYGGLMKLLKSRLDFSEVRSDYLSILKEYGLCEYVPFMKAPLKEITLSEIKEKMTGPIPMQPRKLTDMLSQSASTDNIECFKFLLLNGAEPDHGVYDAAGRKNNDEIMQLLIEHPRFAWYKASMLEGAIIGWHHDAVTWLLERITDGNYGMAPYAAIGVGNLWAFLAFMEHGMTVTYYAPDVLDLDYTIVSAADLGRIEFVELLVENGADPTQGRLWGGSLIDNSYDSTCDPLVEAYLVAHGARKTKYNVDRNQVRGQSPTPFESVDKQSTSTTDITFIEEVG